MLISLWWLSLVPTLWVQGRGRQLRARQHHNVLLLLGEAKLATGKASGLQLPFTLTQFPRNHSRVFLLSSNPVEGHLRAHVVVECSVGVVCYYFLPGALPLPHGFERPIPVKELKDRHELLELQHGPSLVSLQHEAEGADPRTGIVSLVGVTLGEGQVSYVLERKSVLCGD